MPAAPSVKRRLALGRSDVDATSHRYARQASEVKVRAGVLRAKSPDRPPDLDKHGDPQCPHLALDDDGHI